jgi:hypothetical protein
MQSAGLVDVCAQRAPDFISADVFDPLGPDSTAALHDAQNLHFVLVAGAHLGLGRMADEGFIRLHNLAFPARRAKGTVLHSFVDTVGQA